MVKIYVDGKEVTEDKLEKIELHQEGIKKMFAEKMTIKNESEKQAVGA